MISIYVVQIILILIFGYIFRNDKKKFLTAAFIILFVVMAFRHARMIGVDSSTSYYNEYTEIQKAALTWPNPGLQIIMKLLHSVNADYQWVIVITAVWVCFAYYKLLVKYSENGFISVMWFMGMLFYTFLFSALKQAWAMAFLCLAFDAIFKKKPVRFLLFVALAVLFHFPALIFLPAYWIAKLKINRSFPILMFGTVVIVFIFRGQILNLMVSAYSKGVEGQYYSSSLFGTKFIIMVILLGYAFFRYFKVEKDTTTVFSALLYFMGLAAVIQMFCVYNNIFERLADFYYQFSILFMPLLLKRENSDSALMGNEVHFQLNSNINTGETLTKKRITNYSINDIDISTVLAIVITLFCVWRYISTTVNDVLISPFYFFWQ